MLFRLVRGSAANVEIDINDVVNGQILNAERNFIIAHSMGGLVARTLGQMTEPTTSTPLYNGLITIGTPHQGAFAANTLVENPQAIDDVLTNACQKLGAGPAKEGINNSGVLGSIAILFGFGGGVLNDACEYPVYEMQTVRKLSDGFILAESAMNGPGMNYQAQFMDGSNHMQMKNDSEMELAVIKIFIQGLGGEFFKTEER